ncbi:MAG: DUF1593 domain-containing protein [Duncaniella sp.]|nr:DUF1593 domain-containing protein [Duncaniella sp.]
MSRLFFLILTLGLFGCVSAHDRQSCVKPRIIVSTDIGGTDPDDNQSMIHLLMYANEFDIEGLVSSPSFGEGSKEEILRMIALYASDLQALSDGLVADCGTDRGVFPSPEYLASVTRQGARGRAPHCGFRQHNEGSDLIINCARKEDSRPLWILVWGTLDDVAQALHDAPDIADKIRVYWIGGPNKKWGCNAYSYIAENFPSLWFIENNATYRGFIESSADKSVYGTGFYDSFIKGSGNMGNDFGNYYKGSVKMGDSPSLFYLMNGDADTPQGEHWGGSFEPVDSLARYIITGPVCRHDTVACYSLLEWVLDGPRIDVPADSVCFTLTIDRQHWSGYYIGDGKYSVRYSPKAPATLPYVITSEVDGFHGHEGCITVGTKWPATREYSTVSNTIVARPIAVGKNWFTDTQDYSTTWQGACSIMRHRPEIMNDWSKRFGWLRRE